ncbi:MAG: hypothetical protein EA413_02785 [Cyanobium sp. PLM2.Bin73]|nr:MAG: hypothetical protein EA413_02785 [Cyanobium sp. PLM2.Bin73]
MSLQSPTPSPLRLPTPPAPEASQRLAQQLHTLSQVVETLTYRLLELEDRLSVQDRHLQDLAEAAQPDLGMAAAAQGRLKDTEERLKRVEGLLTGIEPATVSPAGPAGRAAGVHDIDGQFPEEPEQPFLDELEAGPEPPARPARDYRGFLTG